MSGCVDCGETDVRVIDPDHVDPEAKTNNVSRMVQLCASEARILAELARCERRCARCHRRKTQVERSSKLRDGRRLPPSWRRRLVRQDWLDALKMRLGCSDCGWAEWARGLDFDHVRGDKVHSVSTLIARGAPWRWVIDEMAKCELVCANCHRIRTCERRGGRGLSPSWVEGRIWSCVLDTMLDVACA